jgi:hypothetical protein
MDRFGRKQVLEGGYVGFNLEDVDFEMSMSCSSRAV